MEVKTFFLLKVRTKSRSRWIEHLIKSQIGVNAAVVDFDKRLLQVSYNQDLISVQYMGQSYWLCYSNNPFLCYWAKEIPNKL